MIHHNAEAKRGLAHTLFSPWFHVKRRVANKRRQATDEGTSGNWHGVVGNHKQTAANGILFFLIPYSSEKNQKRSCSLAAGSGARTRGPNNKLRDYMVPLALHITGSRKLTTKCSLFRMITEKSRELSTITAAREKYVGLPDSRRTPFFILFYHCSVVDFDY